MSITFVKVPVSVSDDQDEYMLFDLLLPYQWDDEVVLTMVRFIMKLRSVFVNKVQVSYLLASFLQEQPFSIFNMIYISQQHDQSDQSNLPLKTMKIGTDFIPLSDVECDTPELLMKLTMLLMKTYVKQKHVYPI
jgi:hypothetical protein